MAVIAGYRGAVYIAAQSSIPATQVALTDSGDHKTYTVSIAAERYWDDLVTVTVEESTDAGSSWHAAPTHTTQYVGGIVTFPVANNASYLYRASFSYLPVTQVAEAFKWSVTFEHNLVNSQVFGDTWEMQTATTGKWSGTFDLFWQDSTFFIPTSRVVVQLFVDHTNDIRWEGFAFINQDTPSADENALVMEAVGFTGTGALYYDHP